MFFDAIVNKTIAEAIIGTGAEINQMVEPI
jgi:hypothetical protein